MAGLVQNRWARVSAGYVLSGVLLVVIIVVLVSAGDSSAVSVGDRMFLTSGGTAHESGHIPGAIAKLGSQITVDVNLPLTAAEAVAAGYTDPIYCAPGRGRYFQEGPAGEGYPFLLMYNGLDELIGIYHIIKNEMPEPWKQMDKLLGGGGLTVVDYEHWGLFVYYQDPTRACGAGLISTGNP